MTDRWQDIAREWVEPWDGCRLTSGSTKVGTDLSGYHVCYATPDNEHPWGKVVMSGAASCPDLANHPTAREAVARLALFLGAQEWMVNDSVGFYWSNKRNAWVLEAGSARAVQESPGCEWYWVFSGPLIPADNRPLAIATAWREARKAK